MNEVRKKLVILAFIIANLAMADNVITKTHNFPINGDRFNKTRNRCFYSIFKCI